MEDQLLFLENEFYKISVFNPLERTDPHFSTRYSHSGYIQQIVCKPSGRELLSSPRKEFNPFSGEGFPDEFETPVGYNDAVLGGRFLKLGVGQQIKREDKPYTNRDAHEIFSYAETGIRRKEGMLSFSVSDSLGEYAYQYEKTIALQGKDLLISHTLSNTGNAILDTLWYPHPCLSRGEEKDFIFFECSSDMQAKSDGKPLLKSHSSRTGYNVYRISPCDELDKGICFVWVGSDEKNEQAVCLGEKEIWHTKGNFPLYEMQLFVNDRVISPEPKLKLSLGKRKTYCWSTKYLLNCTG